MSAPGSALASGLAVVAAAWPRLSGEARRAILERVEREIGKEAGAGAAAPE